MLWICYYRGVLFTASSTVLMLYHRLKFGKEICDIFQLRISFIYTIQKCLYTSQGYIDKILAINDCYRQITLSNEREHNLHKANKLMENLQARLSYN
ncbi:hypothetical protein TrispH2_011198 [Trichoplax sp. H2]|nr:hypothetical protein TrispH2_011198 [Trichoplax sp. H2]|eukprot:RDD36536.1 hypothetical protein TrispH2_011198 [Trichoplax sp. H2]